MLRPASILTFERCYLGAWAVGLLNTIFFTWKAGMRSMAANPAVASMGPAFASTMMIGAVAFGAAITFLLWYLVARKGSVVAKWIVVVFFGFSVLTLLWGLMMGGIGINAILPVIAVVLQGIAVAMLFRPDALEWFGELPEEPIA